MVPSGERRLLAIWRRLDGEGRHTLLAFAEFLATRHTRPVPSEPRDIPRPARETVTEAMRRLVQTYPMLDRDRLLHEAAGLMAEHVLGGRPAAEVIDELEALFARHHRELTEGQGA